MSRIKEHEGATKRERRKETVKCGKRVNEYILRMDGTIADIARDLGISETQVRNIRNNGQIATMDAVYAVAEHAKKPASHFFMGEPEDADMAFMERVYGMAKKVPVKKRDQLIKLLDVFCEAVKPPNSEV